MLLKRVTCVYNASFLQCHVDGYFCENHLTTMTLKKRAERRAVFNISILANFFQNKQSLLTLEMWKNSGVVQKTQIWSACSHKERQVLVIKHVAMWVWGMVWYSCPLQYAYFSFGIFVCSLRFIPIPSQ